MTYSCKYKNNSTFPYKSSKKIQTSYKENKKENTSIFDDSLFSSFLSPIENFIGRKIKFDDILLIIIIFLIFSEKDKENNILLLCLIFILFN